MDRQIPTLPLRQRKPVPRDSLSSNHHHQVTCRQLRDSDSLQLSNLVFNSHQFSPLFTGASNNTRKNSISYLIFRLPLVYQFASFSA